MKTVDSYLSLVPPLHAGAPRFMATVALRVAPFVGLQAAMEGLAGDFDLDDCVGVQEDAVGVRVGRSRTVPVPIPNLYFSFDDPIRGFDRGIWKGPYDQLSGITKLDDETYRRLLRAKIMVNSWDGTIPGQQAILNEFFTDPATIVTAIDDTYTAFPTAPGVPNLPRLTPHMTILVTGKVPSVLDLELLARDLVAARPGGVGMDYVVTSVSQAPVFGFDVQNSNIAGFDSGAWGVSADYVANNAV